jgi:hypothetical protein
MSTAVAVALSAAARRTGHPQVLLGRAVIVAGVALVVSRTSAGRGSPAGGGRRPGPDRGVPAARRGTTGNRPPVTSRPMSAGWSPVAALLGAGQVRRTANRAAVHPSADRGPGSSSRRGGGLAGWPRGSAATRAARPALVAALGLVLTVVDLACLRCPTRRAATASGALPR